MQIIGEKVDNERLSNTRSLRHKNSGLKSVCNQNTPFANSVIKSKETIRQKQTANIKQQKSQTSKQQQDLQKYEQQPNELVMTIFEKCFKPPAATIIKQNQHQTDQLDSRVILMINKTKTENSNHLYRPKSLTIKIGSKAQRYRQNNKSEPKKVYDLGTLSSKYQKSSSQVNKQLTASQKQNMRNTLLKSSPKIFMTQKNSPQIIEFSSKLKRFEEDLKKTKKPRVLTLDLNISNVIDSQQNVNKNYLSLKNHQLLPKSQPLSTQNIYVSPQEERKKYQGLNDDIETVCKISRNEISKKDSFKTLERTKKIVKYALENQQNIKNSKIQEEVRQCQARNLQVESKIDDFGDMLLPKEQIEYVLNRFKQNPSRRKQSTNSSVINVINPSIQYLNNFIPLSSYQNSHEKNFPSNKAQIQQLSYREMESVSFDYKESQTLRDTDYGKKLQPKHQVESPVSERRKSVCNGKSKQNVAQSKLRCLNQGAKTIVTKYDSSDKRSIVEESVILFQCSKDLKPSFSRQLLNDYASRYRGSLGVGVFINQSDQQDIFGNIKDQGTFLDQRQNTLDKILVSPNPNSARFRKSYSIREADNYF